MRTITFIIFMCLVSTIANAQLIEPDVTYTVEYNADEGVLQKVLTPNKVAVTTQAYNISEIQARIDKIDNVIDLWEAKRAPLQAIVDKYNEEMAKKEE